MRTVLVATDGSEGANRALDYAVQLTKREAADLLIVNVIGGYQGPGGLFRHLSDERQAWLREELKSASATLLQQARERALCRTY